MTKTQQVQNASLALDQNSLVTTQDKRTGDHIVIGSIDGKKGTPRKVFLEINTPERLIEFKLLGVIKGSTPTAIAIAAIGEYKRKLMQETNYGALSKNWSKKLEICLAAQKKLLKLEERELQLDFTNDEQRHLFMDEIKSILHEAINLNKIECSSITHREGRLESQFIKAVNNLEDDFERAFSQRVLTSGDQTQVVTAYFSPADQLQFDIKQPMAVDLTEHLSDNEALNFIEYYYQTRANIEKITLTNDGIKRSGIFHSATHSVYLAQKRSFLRRLAYNTQLSVKVLWSFVKQPVTDIIHYLKKQRNALSNSIFDSLIEIHIKDNRSHDMTASSSEQSTIKNLSEQIHRLLTHSHAEPSSENAQQSTPKQSTVIDSAWVRPEHRIFAREQYDNFLAQTLYLLKGNLKKFDNLSKSHEVVTLAISMGGAASLLVLFKAGLIHGALQAGIKSFFHANQMNPYDAIARPLHTMDYLAKLSTMGSDISGGNLESVMKNFEDPIGAIELIAASISQGISLETATYPSDEVSQSIEKTVDITESTAMQAGKLEPLLSAQESTLKASEEAEMLAQIQLIQAKSLALLAKNLENRKKEILEKPSIKTSFIGAAVVFALRPIFAVIKPTVAFAAAGVAAIQLKSTVPLQVAAQEWKHRLGQGIKKLALMTTDFSDTLIKGIYDIAAFCIRTPIKATFTIVRKLLGTTNDFLIGTIHLLGFKGVQETPLKPLLRGLVATEDFLVNRIGRIFRKARNGIGKIFNVARDLIAPNGPVERLNLAAETLKTSRYALQYQYALIQKSTQIIDHQALSNLLLNKIQLIDHLTADVLEQTKHYQQALRDNSNPEDRKKYAEALKSNLTNALSKFDRDIADTNLSLDLSRISSKKEALADMDLENRRKALDDIIQQIPIAPTSIKPATPIEHAPQHSNALFEKESIASHAPKTTPFMKQETVLEALHQQFRQDIEHASKRAPK